MPKADSAQPEPEKLEPEKSGLVQIDRIRSIPSLAAALRETEKRSQPKVSTESFGAAALVPMYSVGAGSASEEAASVAHVVTDISERLRRMGAAYGEWDTFDGSAYFDIETAQCEWLLKIVERVSTVYIVFCADLLLPSFRSAESFWAEKFYPAYHAIRSTDSQLALRQADSGDFADFFETVQPEMTQRWRHAIDVANQARQLLIDDIGYMATNGSQEERLRHRLAWQQSAAPNLDVDLLPALQTIPSLTLSFEFMLPAHRQPERLQRLRRNRARALLAAQRKNREL